MIGKKVWILSTNTDKYFVTTEESKKNEILEKHTDWIGKTVTIYEAIIEKVDTVTGGVRL